MLIKTKPSKKELRQFGLLMGVLFPVVFGFVLPWLFSKPHPRWPFWVAAPFLILGALYPLALGPIYQLWMKLGSVLGWINTRIILSILFYGIFTPISLLRALFKKKNTHFVSSREMKSYRREANLEKTHSFERPF